MSFEALLTQTITLVKASSETYTTDAEGNSTGTPDTADYPGLIQQRDATEIVVGPDTLVSGHLLFLGPDVPIAGTDRVRESGREFEVIGTPNVLNTPRGPHHIECDLRLVTN